MKFTEDMFRIACLFLHRNGDMGKYEKQKFCSFVDAFNGTADEWDRIAAKEIISDVEEQLEDDDDIEQNIADMIDGTYFDYEEKVSLVWLLVNMAYADGNCDDTEKDLLQYVFDEAEIEDESILMELEDTAETLLAIEAKK